MKSFITYVESTSPTSLLRVTIVANPGNPVVFTEDEMRNVTIVHDVHYSGEIRKGKKWTHALVPIRNLGRIDVALFKGSYIGSVWCLHEQRDEMKAKLIAKCKEVMNKDIEAMMLTYKSLG